MAEKPDNPNLMSLTEVYHICPLNFNPLKQQILKNAVKTF